MFITSFIYLIRVQFKLLPVPHCFHNVIRTLNETFQKIFIASLNNNYTSYHTVQMSCFCTLLNYTVYISFMSKILNISNHSKKSPIQCGSNLNNKIIVFSFSILYFVYAGPQIYMVLSGGCIYYFKNEYSTRPAGKFTLYGYNT